MDSDVVQEISEEDPTAISSSEPEVLGVIYGNVGTTNFNFRVTEKKVSPGARSQY